MKLQFGKIYLGGIAGRFAYIKPREKKKNQQKTTLQPTGIRLWFDGMLSSAVVLELSICALLILTVLQLIVW